MDLKSLPLHTKRKLECQGEVVAFLYQFTVEEVHMTMEIEIAIREMYRNKALGGDGVHVEMMKVYQDRMSKYLCRCWTLIGKTATIRKLRYRYNSSPIL